MTTLTPDTLHTFEAGWNRARQTGLRCTTPIKLTAATISHTRAARVAEAAADYARFQHGNDEAYYRLCLMDALSYIMDGDPAGEMEACRDDLNIDEDGFPLTDDGFPGTGDREWKPLSISEFERAVRAQCVRRAA